MTARMMLDKLKEWAVYAFLFLVPIFMVNGMGDTREVQEKFFQGCAMVLASLFFGNIWYTCFFLLNVVLFIVYGGVGASQVLNVFLTGILFACSRNFFKDKPLRPYINSLFLLTALTLIYSVFQVFRADPLAFPQSAGGQVMVGMHNQINGLFFHTIFHSMFLAMMLPALVFSGIWIGWGLLIPILFLKCSGAILATSFTVPFITFHKKRKLFIPLLIIMGLLAGGFTIYDRITDPKTYGSRFYSWHMMVRYTLLNPLGWGPDSFRNFNRYKKFTFKSDDEYNPMILQQQDANTQVLKYYTIDPRVIPDKFKNKMPKEVSSWGEAHNEFIQFVFEYGIFGILFMTLFLKELFLRFRVSDKTPEVLILFSMLMVFAISSITQFPFHVARLSGILGILLGCFFSRTDKAYQLVRGEHE